MLRVTLAEKTIVRQNTANAYTVGIGHIKPLDYIKNDPKKIALTGRISRKSTIESRLKFDANFQLGLANQSQLESLPNGYDNSWQGQL